MKRFAILASIAAALTLIAAAANKFGTPHSIVHVVTILWKEDSTPEQRQASLDGVKKMGIVRTTFILDAEGRIERVFPKVKVDGHIREVLQALGA